MNPPIFFGSELAKLARPGKPEPVLLFVVRVKVRSANHDLTASIDAINLSSAQLGGILKVRIGIRSRVRAVAASGLNRTCGGKKKRNGERNTNRQCNQWAFH